jgi:hypothetical protein
MNRRGFLTGIIAACAAPAIVKAGIIMPIKPALVMANKPVSLDLIDEIYAGVIRHNTEQHHLMMQDALIHGVAACRTLGAVVHRIDPRKIDCATDPSIRMFRPETVLFAGTSTAMTFVERK